VPLPELVRLEVFDAEGKLVKVLLDKAVETGRHETIWDGTANGGWPAPSGIYFYRLAAGGMTLTRKMLLLK
jgi:flagellar hook assembly protein FlgD